MPAVLIGARMTSNGIQENHPNVVALIGGRLSLGDSWRLGATLLRALGRRFLCGAGSLGLDE